MSAYTTLRISRKKAYEFYCQNVLCVDDEELERVLDIHLEDALYNVSLVDDEEDNDDNTL